MEKYSAEEILNLIKKHNLKVGPCPARAKDRRNSDNWASGKIVMSKTSPLNYIPRELLAFGKTLEEAVLNAVKKIKDASS